MINLCYLFVLSHTLKSQLTKNVANHYNPTERHKIGTYQYFAMRKRSVAAYTLVRMLLVVLPNLLVLPHDPL